MQLQTEGEGGCACYEGSGGSGGLQGRVRRGGPRTNVDEGESRGERGRRAGMEL